jgi:hypothetical protein
MSLFDNDRLLHWMAGAVFSWVVMFFLVGFPVFHLWLGVPTEKIATFTGICCAVQLAVTPWVFSARPTLRNPDGRIVVRAAAVIFWSFTNTMIFFYYIRRSWPEDLHTRRFTDIAFVGTPILAIIAFVKFCLMPRKPTQ